MQARIPKEIIPRTTPVHRIECPNSWKQLSFAEQRYAYQIYKASWEGAKVIYFTKSYESPAIFCLLRTLFGSDVKKFKERCLAGGIPEEDWEKLTAYSAAFYQNCANFKSFGDTKFVPEFGPDEFKRILELSEGYEKPETRAELDKLFSMVEKEMFTEDEPFAALGFSDKNGVSAYYSGNVTEAEAKLVDEFCIERKLSPLNTRLFKMGDKEFTLLVCSAFEDQSRFPMLGEHEFKDIKISVKAGHLSPFMLKVANYLKEAGKFAANDTQRAMMAAYYDHFAYGNIDDHKKSQSLWIKDVGPVVESDIGFIETYVDPLGSRAEFEGFVALVDKETSAKFNQLVADAESLIERLPWSKDFEKPKFSKPDFTNLDIVAFGCGGTPIGINIPNYDDIRQNEGFKNVNLGNVYPKPKLETIQFLSEEDAMLMCEHFNDSLTLIVALHELLGHGTGKLFEKDAEGNLNFDPAAVKNPFNGEDITTFYQAGESWSQKFGKLHSGYEECRADSVAMHLMHFERPFEIFFPDKKAKWDEIYYIAWMDMLHGAVKGLQFYNADTQVWGQAHIVASYVILRVAMESNPGLVTFEFTEKDGKDYFVMHVDRSKLRTEAFEALSAFLHKLHVYKSMGDFEKGKELFEKYSAVDEQMLKLRKIVIDWKLPRRIELQPNLFYKEGDEKVEYRDYEATQEGVIQSFADRYGSDLDLEMLGEWFKECELTRRSD